MIVNEQLLGCRAVRIVLNNNYVSLRDFAASILKLIVFQFFRLL